MLYNDATFSRDHRWIEGQVALSTPLVASHARVEQAMWVDLLCKEALSNA